MISHPNSQNTKKKTSTYGIGNTGPGLGQAQKSVHLFAQPSGTKYVPSELENIFTFLMKF